LIKTFTHLAQALCLHVSGYFFRLCLAGQSIDEQACRLHAAHACMLSICDDLLRDPSAMSVWILAAVPDFCYAWTLGES